MQVVKVFFEDGDSFITRINGTEEEIKNYYLGNIFNLGCVNDKMLKCVNVEFLGEEKGE